MMQNTAKVDLAAEETDVKAVKEHLHNNTTEQERQAVVDLTDWVHNGVDDEENLQEDIESVRSEMNLDILPFELDEYDELETFIREASEEFEEIQDHPRGQEVFEMVDVTIGYFYREDVYI